MGPKTSKIEPGSLEIELGRPWASSARFEGAALEEQLPGTYCDQLGCHTAYSGDGECDDGGGDKRQAMYLP